MAILKVARLGHPVLRQKAANVDPKEIGTPEFQRFLDDMVDTMREYDGVGLAAPQVHASKQIFVCEVEKNPRYPEAPSVPLTCVINPVLKDLSDKKVPMWEGCLSIPDMRGVVPRHESLICEGLDRKGKPLTLEVSGFFARVIQHEWDHLQGHVYPDRMKDLRTLTFLQEFGRYWVDDEED
ncbi:MAG TPA: peptide deformylase [Verrucomicrobiae bacterium]|jgi:peptide deformylase|nr:peptide deformylase [Verrucomicrobiae bacterium]